MELPLYAALSIVSAYRRLTELPPFSHALALLEALETESPEPRLLLSHYISLYDSLIAQGYDSLGAWLFDMLRYIDSPYGEAVGKGKVPPSLLAAAQQDIHTFQRLSDLSSRVLKNQMAACLPSPYDEAALRLPEWEPQVLFSFASLTTFYENNGCGVFARYRAFVWENQSLTPIPEPDMPDEEEMIGYRLQRDQVEENTRALLSGHFVNNVLLYGEAGTGKSATVKSLLSVPGFENLRLIEVQKEQLQTLPLLMRRLDGKKQKFILFLDDLTFEDGDTTPSVLKTILEGGLEPRPRNTAIYATSNRRHLVREFFSERGKDDEITAEESIQEKTSLSERFGLRIPYLSLNQADYLSLVDQLAQKARLPFEPKHLHRMALQWEMYHPGRTPRTARQFIASLSSNEINPV